MELIADMSNIVEGKGNKGVVSRWLAVRRALDELQPGLGGAPVTKVFDTRVYFELSDDARAQLAKDPGGLRHARHADTDLLRLATSSGAIVISNDNFTDFHRQYRWLLDDGRLMRWALVGGGVELTVTRAVEKADHQISIAEEMLDVKRRGFHNDKAVRQLRNNRFACANRKCAMNRPGMIAVPLWRGRAVCSVCQKPMDKVESRPFTRAIKIWTADRDPNSALRIGMVSGETLLLGRNPEVLAGSLSVDLEALLATPLPRVSRRHLIVDLINTNVSVIDLGSTNGTERDGRSMEADSRTALNMGQRLRLGGQVWLALSGRRFVDAQQRELPSSPEAPGATELV